MNLLCTFSAHCPQKMTKGRQRKQIKATIKIHACVKIKPTRKKCKITWKKRIQVADEKSENSIKRKRL